MERQGGGDDTLAAHQPAIKVAGSFREALQVIAGHHSGFTGGANSEPTYWTKVQCRPREPGQTMRIMTKLLSGMIFSDAGDFPPEQRMVLLHVLGAGPTRERR
jgi:hypothetical protein